MAASLDFRSRFFLFFAFHFWHLSTRHMHLLYYYLCYRCCRMCVCILNILGIGMEFVRGKIELHCSSGSRVGSVFLIYHFESQFVQWSVSQMVASVQLICIMGAKHLMNTHIFFLTPFLFFSSLRFFPHFLLSIFHLFQQNFHCCCSTFPLWFHDYYYYLSSFFLLNW